MEKINRLRKASDIAYKAVLVFAGIMTAGLIGDIVYRIADQMWSLGRYCSIISLMIGSFGTMISVIAGLIINRAYRKQLMIKLAEVNANIERLESIIESETTCHKSSD